MISFSNSEGSRETGKTETIPGDDFGVNASPRNHDNEIENDMKPVDYTKLSSRRRRSIREKYVKYQGGKCYWCGGDLDCDPPNKIMSTPVNKAAFPNGFFRNPVHLQHCHRTGMTEGAVHARCDAIMWQYHRR